MAYLFILYMRRCREMERRRAAAAICPPVCARASRISFFSMASNCSGRDLVGSKAMSEGGPGVSV